MGKGGGDAPDYPDPQETAAAQAQANIETAIAQMLMNNANQQTPFGSIQYTQTGTQRVGEHDVPLWNIRQSLSPEQQELFDSSTNLKQGGLYLATNLLQNAAGNLSQPFTLQGLPGLTTDMNAFRDQQADALMSRFNEDIGQREDQMRTRLANQGIEPGSEAFNAEMKNLQRARTDAGSQAYQQAGAEAQRQFGMEQALRNQGINERQMMRSQPINEIMGLLGMGGGVQQPQFQSGMGANLQSPDIMGLTNSAYNAQMNQYNQQQSNQQNMMGGLFGMASSALPLLLSDMRAKQDISPVGILNNGLTVYAYRYKGDGPMQIGLIAQEVEMFRPEAVTEIAGLKHVDYEKAVEA